MTRDDWEAVEPLLTSALSLSEDDARLLLQTAALNEIVREELQRALDAEPSWPLLPDDHTDVAPGLIAREVKAADLSLTPGEAIGDGRFVVIRQVGRGGMGSVYLAQDTLLGTLVALKFVHEGLIEEAQRAAVCSGHDHIVAIHNALTLEHRGHTLGVLVMDYVDGRPVSRILDDGPVECGLALRWVRQAADAVGWAHDHDVLHCDVKPANLIVTADGGVTVVDFGIARATYATHERNAPIRGTLPYMPPERFAGEFTRAGDVYSLGVVLFELLTGRPPFEGDSPLLRLQIMAVPPPRLADLKVQAPPGLQEVLDKALAKSPDDRFRSARAFARALEHLDPDQTSTVPVPGGMRAAREQPGPWSVLAGAVVAVTALTATLGFIACRAFEVVLRVDSQFAASPLLYFRLGSQGLLPFVIYWIPCAAALAGAAGGKALLFRYTRLGTTAWMADWNRPSPTAVAVSTTLVGLAAWILLTTAHAGIFSALFDLQQNPPGAAVHAISFAARAEHLRYAIYSACLSFLLLFAGLWWFPALRARARDGAALKMAEWAILAVALLAIAGPTVPRRFLFERFRIVEYKNRAMLEIGISPESVLLFDPNLRVSLPVPAGSPDLVKTAMNRPVFVD